MTIDNYLMVRKRRPRRHRKPRIEIEKIESTDPWKPKSTCPDNSEYLEILATDLILDLPGYVNREIQRDRQSNEDYLERNIVIAGRPEFEPLPIDDMPFFQEDINQIFLTTLERQYRDNQVVELQQFHWLFLRKSQRQWELVNMFSIEESLLGNLPPQPEDSSNGVFARGIRVWLQGCYFGDRGQETGVKSQNEE
ncbi:MAG: hypothetical protein F6K35_01920 [Okeania sp. SIO2H7]|nr:hypothetical protein [Okeania sp. SIO2H7]NEP72796.1 hypothetical protein [Okeania sp. SIO2G5]